MQKKVARVALVTGAARRIGAEITHHLHQAGMNLILHFNTSIEEATALTDSLNHIRANSAVNLAGDLRHFAHIETLAQKAVNIWGRLDVLINNASIFYPTVFGEVTDTAWSDLMDSNLKAPFFLAQAVSPYLAQTEGTIINITDIHAQRPLRDYSVYCLSKAGLMMMTKTLAKELAPKIRVNAVAPGAIIWPEGINELTLAEKNKIISHTLLKKSGSAGDIAKAVLFFIQDAAYITGQVLDVDGGRSLCA